MNFNKLLTDLISNYKSQFLFHFICLQLSFCDYFKAFYQLLLFIHLFGQFSVTRFFSVFSATFLERDFRNAKIKNSFFIIIFNISSLKLNPSHLDPRKSERINLKYFLTLVCCASKDFMKPS